MQFARTVRGIASACLVSVLAACGGGGGGEDDGAKSPNTLTVVNGGDSSVAAGVYTLETTYSGVSETIPVSFGTLVLAYPEHAAFDTTVVYLQGSTDKYFVELWDGMGTEYSYMCRSSGWTTPQLQELDMLADGMGMPLSSIPLCNTSADLSSTQRRIRFSNLILHSDSSAGTVTASGDFTWGTP